MIQGIERRNMFEDGINREEFLARAAPLVPDTQRATHAWGLMPSHAHGLVRTGRVLLPTLMRRVLTGYAVQRGEGTVRAKNYDLMSSIFLLRAYP